MTEVHVLTNDLVRKRGFLAEHGLSLLIRSGSRTVLFDTGQSDVYVRNALMMGLDVGTADAIVLSHGHYDHCGGVSYFPVPVKAVPVFLGRKALEDKYAENPDGSFREIGIPENVRGSDFFLRNLVECGEYTEIFPGTSIHGGIKVSPEDKTSTRSLYVKHGDKMLPDRVEDEQLLVIRESDGLIVFLGCSHPGIVNCVNHVSRVFPDIKIKALFAGMHLESSGEEELEAVMKYFADAAIGRLFPLHCTGIRAISEIKKRFKSSCEVLYTGDSVTI